MSFLPRASSLFLLGLAVSVPALGVACKKKSDRSAPAVAPVVAPPLTLLQDDRALEFIAICTILPPPCQTLIHEVPATPFADFDHTIDGLMALTTQSSTVNSDGLHATGAARGPSGKLGGAYSRFDLHFTPDVDGDARLRSNLATETRTRITLEFFADGVLLFSFLADPTGTSGYTIDRVVRLEVGVEYELRLLCLGQDNSGTASYSLDFGSG